MVRPQRFVSILLLEDVENLGEVGDVIDVKPGYARNFLFPAGAACRVTAEAMRRVERAKEDALKMRARRAAELQKTAAAFEGMSLTFEQRASEEGHLFGSVGAAAIVEMLAEKGVQIDEKHVMLDHPIKELGIFNVAIHLDTELNPTISVWVVEPSA